MTKRIVTVDDVTGVVISEWFGGDEQTLPDRAGVTHLTVQDDGTTYSGKTWKSGDIFEEVAKDPVPPTQLDRIEALLLEIQAAVVKP